jgi:hypothetical protein
MMQESERKNADFPGKDAVHRFLNYLNFAWNHFSPVSSSHIIEKVIPLTIQKQTSILIIDDSAYERNRSKKMELLAQCKDYTNIATIKAFAG